MKVDFNVRKLTDTWGVNNIPKDKVLYGSYHSSNFWNVKGYASSRWMAVFNISVDYEKYIKEHELSLVEIAELCLADMSKIPERKKFTKRLRRPPFGNLELYRVYPKKDEEGSYLQVMAITNLKRSKHLWRFGDECEVVRTKKRRSPSGKKNK